MENYLNFISDIYCEKDQLGFDKYIDTLSGMIRDRNFKTPFCIGIFGKWGSGKTSFMHLLENKLSEDSAEPHAIPVWFNPWRYEKEDHLIIPFLKTIESEVDKYSKERKSAIGGLYEKLQGFVQKAGEVAAAFAYGLKADCKLGGFGIELDISKMADREEKLLEKRIEKAKLLSRKLSSLYYEIVNELKDAVDEKSFRIVVFIDDLDRCLPEKAVELLEAIKLFLDIAGYLFVIGVDRDVIKKGIAYRYRHFEFREEKEGEGLIISPEDYLEKMIQLPLELPKIEPGRKRSYIQSLLGDTDDFKEHADIIEIGVGENPRTLKRFINLLAFTVRLAETVKDNILNDRVEAKETDDHKAVLTKFFIPLLYLKWSIIVFRFPKVHNDIKGNWRRLIDLQAASKKEETRREMDGPADEAHEEKKGEKQRFQIDERLKQVLSKEPLFPNNEWLIARFIHLTESTVLSDKKTAVSSGYRQTFKTGDMVLVPKGTFLYGEEKVKREIKADFYIDAYPVTNGQYKEFIDASEHGLPYSEDEDHKPYCWSKEDRMYPKGLENHPVVFVSYNDVVAFCTWRSEKEGMEFRLPTEEEWEKAARGEDGREYPWGNEFGYNNLNCADYHVKRGLKSYDEWKKYFINDFYEKNKDKALTSDVGRFEQGISPYGCFDMAGNVWEWTSSGYDKEAKVLRGGSWNDNQGNVRCASRHRYYTGSRDNDIGFRCARTLK